MLPRRNMSSHSLASLVIAPDDHEYLRKVRNILEEQPRTGPPDEPTELCPYLYMGSLKNANNVPLLKRLGITHVLNCAGNGNLRLMRSPYNYDSNIVGYLTINAEDHAEYDIMRHFDETFAFLDNCKRSGGKALVHCNLGINRSGAICAAYLMVDQQMSLVQVVSLLKRKRNLVLCNKGFRRQLIRFARTGGYLDSKSNKKDHIFGWDRTNTLPQIRYYSASYKDYDRSDVNNDAQGGRIIKPYGRSKSASVVNSQNYQTERSSNTLHVPSMTNGSSRPSRFAPEYRSLPNSPKTSTRASDTPARKRPLNASHYDKEYFMDTIPEDGRFMKGHNDVSKSEKLPKKDISRTLSASGNRSFISFRKSKSKSTDCINGVQTVPPANESMLSSTRPLRVYKRSVTDTELYEKPTVTHQYKRADTVATTDITAGIDRLNVSDCNGDVGTLSRQQRSVSKLSLSSSFFSKLKPELWKRSSRTSLNINA